MSSKSLPTTLRHHDYREKATNNNRTIGTGSHGSIKTFLKDKGTLDYNTSNVSSYVKTPSPLAQQNPFSSSYLVNKNQKTNTWSAISSSVALKRKRLKNQVQKSWGNRKTRTFPSSNKLISTSWNKGNNRKYRRTEPNNKNRQSLQDILSHFSEYEGAMKNFNVNNTTIKDTSCVTRCMSYKSKIGSTSKNSCSPTISSLSLSKQTQKRRKKQKNRPPSLIISKYDPPATMSSQKSTPITPLKFPTPPKRFSAYCVNLGDTVITESDYKRPSGIKGAFKTLYSPLIIQQKNEQGLIHTQCYEQYLVRNICLFALGFLFFPFWWMGTLLYIYQKKELLVLKRKQQDQGVPFFTNEFDLMSLHTFGYLNSFFSCLSLVLIIVFVSLFLRL